MITKLLTEQVMFQITENMINNGGSFATSIKGLETIPCIYR